MRRLCSIAIVFVLPIFEPTLANGAQFDSFTAPTQLYGKSITLKWAAELEIKYVTGETKNSVHDLAYGFYVSSKGRVFARSASLIQGRQLRRGESRDPEGGVVRTPNFRYSGVWQFHGRTLIGYKQFDSGVRRVTVDFDEGFRNCNLSVVYGKENGVPGLIGHGPSTRLAIVQAKVSSPSCTITDGNMFGGNSD
jgi:hypothetical protein